MNVPAIEGGGIGQGVALTCVIPIWNGERFVTQIAEMIEGLDADASEFVIVDDGSTDASLLKARKVLADQVKVRIVASETDPDPAAARGRGLAHATGEWIAYADMDGRLNHLRATQERALPRSCG